MADGDDLTLGTFENYASKATTIIGGDEGNGAFTEKSIFGAIPSLKNVQVGASFRGIIGSGCGAGIGVTGTGGALSGLGVEGIGGAHDGTGVAGTGGAPGGAGVVGTGGAPPIGAASGGGAGVVGAGGTPGGDGVRGNGGGSGAGVRGIGGHARDAGTLQTKSGGGTGVHGEGGDTTDSALRPGIGVTGRGGALRGAPPVGGTAIAGPIVQSEAGVLGVTAGLDAPKTEDTKGIGVVGCGRIGVKGIGKGTGKDPGLAADRGGIFQSDDGVPQLQLMPSAVKPLPLLGRAGDFFVMSDPPDPQSPTPSCQLYFCVRGHVGAQAQWPAVWKKVMLG